jgi:transposase-like protein
MPKDNRNNKRYPKELKESMVSKLLPPSNMTLAELSAESGIPKTTLYGWKTKALKKMNNSSKSMNFKMIKEARQNGARLKQACEVVGITDRTYQRWIDGDNIREDQRPYADRLEPANKLTKEEYNSVVKITNLPEYADLPPSQIVPSLADKGIYIASESTMYRILKKENMQQSLLRGLLL